MWIFSSSEQVLMLSALPEIVGLKQGMVLKD